MTSQGKDNIVIAEHGIITQEALLAYLNDELTSGQKQELESLLKDDPFAQDALEGMRVTQDRKEVQVSLTSIQRKVKERTGAKERKIMTMPMHWSTYAFAAVILGLLISVGFILTTYMNRHNENVALDNKPVVTEQTPEIKPAPVTPPPVAKDTVIPMPKIETPPVTIAQKEEPVKNAAPEKAKKNDAEKPAPKQKTEMAADEKVETQSGGASTAMRGNAGDINKAAKTKDISNTSTAPTGGKVMDAEKEVTANDGTGNVAIEEARKTFYLGNYKKAAEEFNTVLKDQPDNSEALFFSGVSEYVNNNTDASEKRFDNLLKKGTKFVDGSKWYKASILVRKGKKEEAKKLFEELANGKGSYSERAKKKLADGL